MRGGGRRIHAGTVATFGEGACRRIRDGEADIVVVKAGGKFHAFDNSCPHQHFADLHRGLLEEHTLTCPMHGWNFDVRTGASLSGDGRLRMHVVTIQGDDVWISTEH